MILACPSCRSISIITGMATLAPRLCARWDCVTTPRIVTDDTEAALLLRAALLGHDHTISHNPLPEERPR